MTPERCANCNDILRSGGRKSKSGKRYCTARPECRAAKQRNYMRSVRGTQGKIENRPCSCCGDPMLSRNWRTSDTEAGRWCRKARCQEQRRIIMAAIDRAGGYEAAQAQTEAEVHELFVIAAAKPRVECPVCHLVDAVDLYPHLDAYAQKCVGTGSNRVLLADIEATWPGDREYNDEG